MVCQVEIDKTNEPTIGPRIGPNELIAIKNDMKEVNSTPWYLSQAMLELVQYRQLLRYLVKFCKK